MTENKNTHGANLPELDELLATYGADRTRWPAPERLRFAGLIGSDAGARRRLAEAAALDRLLDLAPRAASENEALASRIVAAAVREGASRRPIVLGGPRNAAARAAARGWAAGWRGVQSSQFQAAAVLAASLVIGAMVGTSGAVTSAIEPLAAEAAGATEGESDPSQLAGVEVAAFLDEDLL